MRNPNRTTKPERRAIRRYNPYAARILGVAQAARWYRDGILLDEAEGFDNILDSVLYGPVPLDLNELVNAALAKALTERVRLIRDMQAALARTENGTGS